MANNALFGDVEFTSSSSNVRNLILVGKTGNGKSASGNSILGGKAFVSKFSSAGVTKTSEQMHRRVLNNGQILNVIDTPGLFDTSDGVGVIGKEIVKFINMAKEGIHAILVVLSVRSRFTREEGAVVERLREFFGTKISDHTIVLFTGGDELENNKLTLDEYLGHNCPQPLTKMLEMCGNRRILFDNKTTNELKKSKQLNQLLALVGTVVDNNGGMPYTDELFLEMQKEALKACDQTAEVNSLKGYSIDQSNLKFLKSSEEQFISRMTEMVESKLKEQFDMIERNMADARSKPGVAFQDTQKLKDETEKQMQKTLQMVTVHTQLASLAVSACALGIQIGTSQAAVAVGTAAAATMCNIM